MPRDYIDKYPRLHESPRTHYDAPCPLRTCPDRPPNGIADILESEPKPSCSLLVAVTVGRCRGSSKVRALDSQLTKTWCGKDGARVLIEPVSLDFLAGAESN